MREGSIARILPPDSSSLIPFQRCFKHLPDKPLIGHLLRRRFGLYRVEQRGGDAHVDLSTVYPAGAGGGGAVSWKLTQISNHQFR